MKGGDFTRLTFKPSKHYTHVLKQQGRVDVDSDEIENEEIQDHLRRTEAKDVIGLCGAPKGDHSFAIGLSTDGQDLTITPGRFYVDGILCELEAPSAYSAQPYYPNPSAIDPVEGRVDLVYLDVWRRHITAIEDPDIREVALGGPDTTTRLQTVFQIKVQTNVTTVANVGRANCDDAITGWPPAASGGRLTSEAVSVPPPENPCDFLTLDGYRGLENRLYAVEIHDGGNLGTATFKWSRDNCSIVFPIEEFVNLNDPARIKITRVGREQVLALRIGDWIEVLDDKNDYAETAGTMAQIRDIDASTSTVTLDRGISAGIYAIRNHARIRRWDQTQSVNPNGLVRIASRAPIQLEDGVQVSFSGRNFRTRDYWAFAARTATTSVEKLTGAPPFEPVHHYCRLALITWHSAAQWQTTTVLDCRPEFSSLVDVQKLLDALYNQREIRYVSGDGQEGQVGQQLPGALMVGVEDALGHPIPDANVTFAVTSGGGTVVPSPPPYPNGIATCQWTLGSSSGVQTVEATLSSAPQGNTLPIHFRAVGFFDDSPTITEVSWTNDQSFPLEVFLHAGLKVGFSQPMNPATVTTDNFIVTMEIPDQVALSTAGPTYAGHRSLILDGVVVQQRGGRVFMFKPSDITQQQEGLKVVVGFWLNQEEHLFPASVPSQIRCRVTLKGATILGENGRPLTGHAIGLAGAGSTELVFPSEDGSKGSDFESWFYITQTLNQIDINSASLTELASIPGITQALAQAVIDHRPYAKLTDLLNVPGIDSQMLSTLTNQLTVLPLILPSGRRAHPQSKKPDAARIGKRASAAARKPKR